MTKNPHNEVIFISSDSDNEGQGGSVTGNRKRYTQNRSSVRRLDLNPQTTRFSGIDPDVEVFPRESLKQARDENSRLREENKKLRNELAQREATLHNLAKAKVELENAKAEIVGKQSESDSYDNIKQCLTEAQIQLQLRETQLISTNAEFHLQKQELLRAQSVLEKELEGAKTKITELEEHTKRCGICRQPPEFFERAQETLQKIIDRPALSFEHLSDRR